MEENMKRLTLAMVAAALFLNGFTSPAYAFTRPGHEESTTIASQRVGGLRPEDLNIIMCGNLSHDDIQVYWTAQERHFTGSFFEDGIATIQSEWDIINTTNDRVTALLAFGRILHAVQDFYSHSNWVELNERESTIPVWDMRTISRDLWSGYWPDDAPSFARNPNTPNHHDSNKDNAEKIKGRQKVRSGPNEGKTYFELAKEVATRATEAQLRTFLPILDRRFPVINGKSGFKINDLIKWPNGRAYFFSGNYYFIYLVGDSKLNPTEPVGYIREKWPGLWSDGLDASVMWNNNKAYFFKGDEYIRFDIRTDKADPGYPKPISQWWRGLWTRGIDAAVNWGNGRAYFFKGDEYIRFDISSDKADSGYPKKISEHWPGLWPDGVDAAVNWGNGKVYFIKGDQYIRWDIASDRIDAGFPKPLHGNWGGF
jgi:Hemopexin